MARVKDTVADGRGAAQDSHLMLYILGATVVVAAAVDGRAAAVAAVAAGARAHVAPLKAVCVVIAAAFVRPNAVGRGPRSAEVLLAANTLLGAADLSAVNRAIHAVTVK